MAFGGIAALAMGGAMLLASASAAFVPVIGMVGGVAAMALANHERMKEKIEALEKRLAPDGMAEGSIVPVNRNLSNAVPTRSLQPNLTTILPRLRMFISGPLCVFEVIVGRIRQ